jgi:hypothetical protein
MLFEGLAILLLEAIHTSLKKEIRRGYYESKSSKNEGLQV